MASISYDSTAKNKQLFYFKTRAGNSSKYNAIQIFFDASVNENTKTLFKYMLVNNNKGQHANILNIEQHNLSTGN